MIAHNLIMYVQKLTSFLIDMQKNVLNSDNKDSFYIALVLVTVFIITLYNMASDVGETGARPPSGHVRPFRFFSRSFNFVYVLT